jgi:hypothetical protein
MIAIERQRHTVVQRFERWCQRGKAFYRHRV